MTAGLIAPAPCKRTLPQGRTTGRCTRTYLGATKACGDPKISVYSATDASVLTVWQLDVTPLPSPPVRRPPPKVQPVRTNPPPMVKRSTPPPRRSPPPRMPPPSPDK